MTTLPLRANRYRAGELSEPLSNLGNAMNWTTCKKLACADWTLRLLVKAIREANASGNPDRIAYGAFMDRCQELGLSVPNRAYWSILLGVVVSTIN